MIRLAALGVVVGLLAAPQLSAQRTVSFEQVVGDLGSDRVDVRLAAVRALKASPYPESAVPLSRVVVDPDDLVQMEAIGAILNIYLAEKIVPSRRVGLIVEVRSRVAAEAAFDAGSSAVEPRPVPDEVLAALRTALQDEHPRVALEAAYAFGILAPEVSGPQRAGVLRASANELAGRIGSPRPDLRLAAVRVIDRLYAVRPGDPPVPESVGDALVTALNDTSAATRVAAMNALGALRYARGLQALTDLVNHHERGQTAAIALD
ncbi:MAG: HEAT repeat domain-containing protein, partial [Dehalococcoidia bacterium]